MPSGSSHPGAPPAQVLQEFRVASQDLLPLTGGTTGECFRAGDVVFKPDQDEEVTEWIARLAAEVTPNARFRLARPLRANAGAWTISGWAAFTFEDGGHEHGRWIEMLEAGRALHEAIKHLPRPDFLDRRTDRWFRGDRAVWGEVEIAVPDTLRPQVEALSAILQPVHVRSQVIHSDLCGNTLLHHRLPPAIIDFSPLYRPAEYAEGILVSDAVVWESGPLRLAEEWTTNETRRQMLIRACLFRLFVAAIGWPEMPDRLALIAEHHAPITNWLERHP